MYFCQFTLTYAKFLFSRKYYGDALGLAQKIWLDSVSALKLYATSISCSNLTGQSNHNIMKNRVEKENTIGSITLQSHINNYKIKYFQKNCDIFCCSCDYCGFFCDSFDWCYDDVRIFHNEIAIIASISHLLQLCTESL